MLAPDMSGVHLRCSEAMFGSSSFIPLSIREFSVEVQKAYSLRHRFYISFSICSKSYHKGRTVVKRVGSDRISVQTYHIPQVST